ncbi:MAG: hypothetical protein CMM91_02700 [Rickettsiales bacterium]|nr:hypothetical protein [Rickettsiales bacterium]OUV54550.1 MAG: hypothetical protein CBC87_01445 [Rickettsiales bacterium TMED127]|tara:strand:- start:29734 stop:30186 length:453 start_codon:yes stop_codon:yes gene_type:complete
MEFKILAVGHFSSNNPYRTLFESYQKRMKEKVKLIEIKNLNYDIQKKLSEEKKLIMSYFELNSEVIILDKDGKNISSIEMADFFKKKAIAGSKKIIFIIGGSHGLHPSLKKQNTILSFGRQTWPHMMSRIMLIEQIYRATSININHPYHK